MTTLSDRLRAAIEADEKYRAPGIQTTWAKTSLVFWRLIRDHGPALLALAEAAERGAAIDLAKTGGGS